MRTVHYVLVRLDELKFGDLVDEGYSPELPYTPPPDEAHFAGVSHMVVIPPVPAGSDYPNYVCFTLRGSRGNVPYRLPASREIVLLKREP